jgi:hypothetical protein
MITRDLAYEIAHGPAPRTKEIMQQILRRLPEARSAWGRDAWAGWYVADVQFLLGRLQALESLSSLSQ